MEDRFPMSKVEAIYESAEQAERAVVQLQNDVDVQEIHLYRVPQTQQLPLRKTQARKGVVIGAGFGMVMGLLAGGLVAWWIGDPITGSAAWMLALGSMLLGALAGGLAFSIERARGVRRPSPTSGVVWLRASSNRVTRLVGRLTELGAKRVEVLEPVAMPKVVPSSR